MPGSHGSGCGCLHETELTNGEDLLPWISVSRVSAVNESVSGSARTLFRPYDERLDDSKKCESNDDDPELIVHIPFTGSCRVGSLIVIGGDDGSHPIKVKIFANNPGLDFTNIEDITPIQELDLIDDFHGRVEYPLRVTQLQNVSHLTLFFCASRNDIQTRLHYLCLRGTGYQGKPGLVKAVFELNPNPSDHPKTKEDSNLAAFRSGF